MAGREYPSSFPVSIDCGDIISPYDASGCNDTDLFKNMTGSRVARDRRSSPTGVETLVLYLSLMPAYLSDNRYNASSSHCFSKYPSYDLLTISMSDRLPLEPPYNRVTRLITSVLFFRHANWVQDKHSILTSRHSHRA